MHSTFRDELILIHLWRTETARKGKRVPKQFLTDCRCNHFDDVQISFEGAQ